MPPALPIAHGGVTSAYIILSISILSRVDFDNFFVIGLIIFLCRFCFTLTANYK